MMVAGHFSRGQSVWLTLGPEKRSVLAQGHRELLRAPATPRSSTNQQPGHACIFNLYIGNSRCYEELRAKIPARSRGAPARDVLHYLEIGNVAAKGLLMAIIYQKCG
jgi:hypothetical protein